MSARLIIRLLLGFDKLNQSTNTETAMLSSVNEEYLDIFLNMSVVDNILNIPGINIWIFSPAKCRGPWWIVSHVCGCAWKECSDIIQNMPPSQTHNKISYGPCGLFWNLCQNNAFVVQCYQDNIYLLRALFNMHHNSKCKTNLRKCPDL